MARISRSSPILITAAQQRAFVSSVENSPDLQDDIETLIGKDWASLTFQQKVQAYQAYVDQGMAIAPLATSARVHHDLHQLASAQRGDLEVGDRNLQLETQVQVLTEENSALRDQVTRLTADRKAGKAAKS